MRVGFESVESLALLRTRMSRTATIEFVVLGRTRTTNGEVSYAARLREPMAHATYEASLFE